jgi:DNA-binding XRE family transcriptional regulator
MARPTKYNKKYDEQIIEFMAQGYSKEAFAGKIGVAEHTIYNWLKKQKSFLQATKKAEAKCRLFWEEMGIEMALSGSGNATAWIFQMKNRFGWRDKKEIETTGGMLIKLDAGQKRNNVQSTSPVSSETT